MGEIVRFAGHPAAVRRRAGRLGLRLVAGEGGETPGPAEPPRAQPHDADTPAAAHQLPPIDSE